MDEEPRRVWHRVIEPFRKRQIASLASEAATAPDVALFRGRLGDPVDKRMARASSNERRMADDLTASLLETYLRGRADVSAELKRQHTMKAAEPDDTDEDDLDVTDPTPAQKAWLRRLAEYYVLGATFTLVGEAIRASMQARQADLPKEQIERRVTRALEDMSVPRQQAILEGQLVRAYTTGRGEQAADLAQSIDEYRYTAILDKGTCEPCEGRDGAVHAENDPNYATPSPFCDWPDNCRCFDVYVAKVTNLEVAA